MRVSTGMVRNQILLRLGRLETSLNRTQERLASGKRINIPSDDAAGTLKALALRSDLDGLAQLQRNIKDARSWLEHTDSALRQMNDVLQRSRELAVTGASETMPQESLDALADEVNELLQQAVQVGNAQIGNRYLFGGYQTTAEPYTVDDPANPGVITYNGDDGAILRQIDQGPGMSVNLTGNEAFNGTAMFDTLVTLRDELRAGNHEQVGGAILDDLDLHLDEMLAAQAKVGARMNRLDTTRTRLTAQEDDLRQTLSRVENADFAEESMKFAQQSTSYKAALSTSARLLNISLVDYMA